MDDAIGDYAATATPGLIAGYDRLSPEQIYAPVRDLLPGGPARIADIGAGTGRDAAWFARMGHHVVAVEPVRQFREAGAALHSEPIEWFDDRLPALDRVGRRDRFELVALCAVWHHLDTPDRAIAMPNLARILAPGGTLILSLRHEPGPLDPHSFAAPPDETIQMANASGLRLTRRVEAGSVHPESQARGVRWTWLALSKDEV